MRASTDRQTDALVDKLDGHFDEEIALIENAPRRTSGTFPVLSRLFVAKHALSAPSVPR
jgi:hypothetical protein